METHLAREVASALGRRRRFALAEAGVEPMRRVLLGHARPGRVTRGQRLTIWLDWPDGSLVTAALSRPWACLELSCSAPLDNLDVWDFTACKTRGPSITQARFASPAGMLPAILAGDALPAGGDGAPGALRQMAVLRTLLAMRGNGPLVPSLVVLSQHLALVVDGTTLLLEWSRTVHVPKAGLMEAVTSGVAPELDEGRPLGGGMLELQGAASLPAGTLPESEGQAGSAFASACAVAFPVGLSGAHQ